MHIELDIHKKYKDFVLSLQYEGECNRIGILGASGCGKSMTLQAIAGIITPDQGRIIIDGQVFFDSDKKINLTPQERRVGYLFQNYALFPNMTVADNIAAGLAGKTKEENRERVALMVKRFALDGLEKRYPKELSGGQQQRVALARIMAYGPRLLMLDEPFSALDSYLKDALRLEMKRLLNQYAGGMILVTHSRDEIYEFSEELVIMNAGCFIEKGPTKEIFKKPHFMETARLTGCKNLSKVMRIDDHHIYATEWELKLETNEVVSPFITHVGIRSHHLHLSSGNEANRYQYKMIDISEKPFEITYLVKPYPSDGNPMIWKLYKDEALNRNIGDLCFLYVAPEDVMILSEVKER